MMITPAQLLCLALPLLMLPAMTASAAPQQDAIPPEQPADRDAWKSALEAKQFKSGDQTLNYRLFDPTAANDQSAAQKPYPLVLFLHGAGERGDDNIAQLKHGVVEFHKRQDQNPCFVVVPQCPENQRWVDADWSESSGRGSFPEQPSATMALVLQVVEDLVKSGEVDPSRVYVTGLSMGGYGTWYAAGREGSSFAAAAPICGGGDPTWAERYVKLPLWAFHGDADTAVPVKRSREMIEGIRAAGGEPKYTEYSGVGHDSWTQTYQDDSFHEWLFNQHR